MATRKICLLPRATRDLLLYYPRREFFAIKLRRAKIHATISQNYLLGGACFARKRKIQIFLNCGNAAISLAHSANFTVRKDNYTHA